MTATFGINYNEIEECWEYYVDSPEPWVWYGIGQVLGRTKVELYPYFPVSFTGKRKEVHGKELSKIGRKIGKRILRHRENTSEIICFLDKELFTLM